MTVPGQRTIPIRNQTKSETKQNQKPQKLSQAGVAQRPEQTTCNRQGVGSIPTAGSITFSHKILTKNFPSSSKGKILNDRHDGPDLHRTTRSETYRQAKPWLILNPQQPFTIEHPDIGEIACCSTLDHNTEEDLYDVGIAIYPGEVGLKTFTKLELGAITLDEDGIEAYAVLDDHKRRRNDAT